MNLTLECATKPFTTCPETVSVQAFEDKATHKPRPVQSYPHICLACWRAGWRYEGPMGDESWRIFQLPGHPQTLPA